MIISSLGGQLEAYRAARKGTQDAANAKKAIEALNVTRIQSKSSFRPDSVRLSASAAQSLVTNKDPIVSERPVTISNDVANVAQPVKPIARVDDKQKLSPLPAPVEDRPIKYAPIKDSDDDSVVDVRPIKPGVGKVPLPAPVTDRPIKYAPIIVSEDDSVIDIRPIKSGTGSFGIAQPVKPIAQPDDAPVVKLNDVRSVKYGAGIASSRYPTGPYFDTSEPSLISTGPIAYSNPVQPRQGDAAQAQRSGPVEPVVDYYTPVNQLA